MGPRKQYNQKVNRRNEQTHATLVRVDKIKKEIRRKDRMHVTTIAPPLLENGLEKSSSGKKRFSVRPVVLYC
jgi:hypothetical protein